MQQMEGSSEFQPPRQKAPTDKPEQMGEASDEGSRKSRERTERREG